MTPPNPITEHDTRRRLLDAAVSIFAAKGYRKTTVRDICHAADANVSAVKYHFGNKEALYNATFDHARLRSNETNPFVQMDKARDFHADQPPERRLYLFIRTMLEHQFRDGEPTELTQLMSHEMMQPTPALDRLIEVSVRRVYGGLVRIVLDLMPAGSTEAGAQKYAMSISAQCHFHHLALPLIQRIDPSQRYTPEALDDLAEHIHRFTLAAIRGADGR
jgi:AcrR family transcriptional regulator